MAELQAGGSIRPILRTWSSLRAVEVELRMLDQSLRHQRQHAAEGRRLAAQATLRQKQLAEAIGGDRPWWMAQLQPQGQSADSVLVDLS